VALAGDSTKLVDGKGKKVVILSFVILSFVIQHC